MAVIKVIELIGSSDKNFAEALKEGIARATKTLRGVKGVDVIGQNVVIEDGKIIEYRVNLKVAFVLD